MDETTILGYRIEKLAEEPGRRQPAYFLHGPAVRCTASCATCTALSSCNAVNARTGRVVALKGVSWFSDKTGRLVACH